MTVPGNYLFILQHHEPDTPWRGRPDPQRPQFSTGPSAHNCIAVHRGAVQQVQYKSDMPALITSPPPPKSNIYIHYVVRTYSCRDYPEPGYPPSSRSKLSDNAYCRNDPRGEIAPPIQLTGDGICKPLLLTADATDAHGGKRTAGQLLPRPGKVCLWDDHSFYK